MDHHFLNSTLPKMKNHHNEHHIHNNRWTFEENKLFERALAESEAIGSSAFFQHVALLLPLKSMNSIKLHYQALIEDLKLIESFNSGSEDEVKEEDQGAKSKKQKITKGPRKRGTPWTEQEHKLFLMGLQEFGKGEWKKISKCFVTTKTPTQVASHAQKFEKRMHSRTPVDKRRPSINDIKVVEDSSFSLDSQRYTSFRANTPQNLVRTTTLQQHPVPLRDHVYNNNYCYNVDHLPAQGATMYYPKGGSNVNLAFMAQPWVNQQQY